MSSLCSTLEVRVKEGSMFQSWGAAYDWAKTRQKELLEEARNAHIARALRAHARASRSRPKAVLCKDCPLRDVPVSPVAEREPA